MPARRPELDVVWRKVVHAGIVIVVVTDFHTPHVVTAGALGRECCDGRKDVS